VSLEKAKAMALPVGAAESSDIKSDDHAAGRYWESESQIDSLDVAVGEKDGSNFVDQKYIGKRLDPDPIPLTKSTQPEVDLKQTVPAKEKGDPADNKSRAGIPWEVEPKSFTSFYRTTKQLLFKPVEFFEAMEPEGKLGSAMLYAVCGSLIGGLFMALIQAAFKIATYDMGGTNEEVLGEHSELIMFGITLTQILIQTAFTVMGCTLGLITTLFMSGLVYHGILWALKGNNRSFEATFRVVSYVTGATSVMLVVPCLGQVVQSFLAPVYTIVGLKNAHETTTSKAVGAVFIPIVATTVIVAGVVGLLLVVGLIAFSSLS
jgi:hypothetical protein